ncbi:hypothetical protein [Streptomyces sp. NBC_00649]|uniref:hypothetical protein n=1 Tax=Streptomyces sp. NBC_00649 TaxID=2975798 RepID=UPI003245F139
MNVTGERRGDDHRRSGGTGGERDAVLAPVAADAHTQRADLHDGNRRTRGTCAASAAP